MNVNRPAKKAAPTISRRVLTVPNTRVMVGISKPDELEELEELEEPDACGFDGVLVCSLVVVNASDIVCVCVCVSLGRLVS